MRSKIIQDVIDVIRCKKFKNEVFYKCALNFKRKVYSCYYRIINYKKIPCYDYIISLGYNCEISFRITDLLGNVESFLFTWVYVTNREKSLKTLDDLEGYKDIDFDILPYGMLEGKTTLMRFHPNEEKALMLNPKDCNIELIKTNLKSKIKYLSTKTNDILASSSRLLFVMKIKVQNLEEDICFVKSVNMILAKKCNNFNYHLLCFIEKNKISQEYVNKIEKVNINSHVSIKFVNCFANDAETKITGDIKNFLNAISNIYYGKKDYVNNGNI